METNAVVSVQKGKTLKERLLSCLDGLGGIHKLVPLGKTILVKPNLVTDKPHSSGAITNPALLEVLLEELLKTSPREIIVGEGSATNYDTANAFKNSGIGKAAEKYGARLVDLQKDHYVQVPVPRGREISRVQVARTVLQADYLLNLPVLKVHSQTKVTVALKNLKGCISNAEKKRFHRLHLEQCIADLNTVIPVHLVVVDATLCSFSWEGGGDPVRLDTVLAGTNQVAVDTVAAPLLGYHPAEIEHLRLSAEHGLGPCDREKIKVLHQEKLEEICLPEQVTRGVKYHIPGLQVIEKGACTPCLGGLLAAQRRLHQEKVSLPASVFLGQRLQEDDLEEAADRVMGIGSCGARLTGKEKAVTGCPPEGWQVYEMLKKMSKR